MKRISLVALSLVFLILGVVQTNSSYAEGLLDSSGILEGTETACFDTYEFGSLVIDATPNQVQYEPGDPVILSGSVKNDNPYPLVDVSVIARLVKNIPGANDQARTITVDEIEILNNITLKAGEVKDFTKNTLLSTKAAPGEYQVLFFGYSKDRFNLAGLSFTDDIYGSKVTFNVGGNNPEGLYFDQTKTTVGGKTHINHAFVTQHDGENPVEIKIPLVNANTEDKTVRVTYDLYWWDGLREEQKITTREEELSLRAGERKELSYTVDGLTEPVYYVKLTAVESDSNQAGWQKSISNIRFVIQDNGRARINYTGLTAFPKTEGVESSVVTCFHNTNNGELDKASIETIVSDKYGREVSKAAYTGKVPSAIAAITAELPADKYYNQLIVTTTLKDKDGNLIDKVVVNYDCNSIDASQCVKDSIVTSVGKGILWTIVLIVSVGLAVYALWLQKDMLGRIKIKK